jgi:hypothetical protein
VGALAAHAEDASDQNLPLMVWWAAEPLATASMDRALDVAMSAKLPNLLPFTVRRIAATDRDAARRSLSTYLARATDPAQQAELLKGLNLVLAPPAQPIAR